ncbi:hypothetical protein ACS0TY_007671 [Phlomoides rotata]
MSQNQKSSNSQGKYKRFYKKFSLPTSSHSSVSSQKNNINGTSNFLPKMPSNPQEHLPAAGREIVIVDEKCGNSRKDEGMFSDYIRKVKNRMTSVSNVGAGKKATRRDSLNDKFSHYISRAKSRFRTPTIAVGVHTNKTS